MRCRFTISKSYQLSLSYCSVHRAAHQSGDYLSRISTAPAHQRSNGTRDDEVDTRPMRCPHQFGQTSDNSPCPRTRTRTEPYCAFPYRIMDYLVIHILYACWHVEQVKVCTPHSTQC